MSSSRIPIRNIYYMLAYAYRSLREDEYKRVSTENFENIHSLFAEILCISVSKQLKNGLYHEYIEKNDSIPGLIGKIDCIGTIKAQTSRTKKIACIYDDFSENNHFNQIIKTTLLYLLRKGHISNVQKRKIRQIIIYFNEVNELDVSSISWGKIYYHKNNRNYELILNICFFVLKGLLNSEGNGQYKMLDFIDDQSMCRLYEKFLLEYYRHHYPELNASATHINWDIEGDASSFLPEMKTDVTLSYKGKKLIIDAKYYSNIFQYHYNSSSFHNGNIYQIFTYVKNMDKEQNGSVSGLLLYAQTEHEIVPDSWQKMQGNDIGVMTLNLNDNFETISDRLNQIVKEKLLD